MEWLLIIGIWLAWKYRATLYAKTFGSLRLKVSGSSFAVLDFETTGLSPAQADRIVQVAVLLVSPSGKMEGHWSSLVNPGRDVGPTFIHGITNKDVATAPTYSEVHDHLMGLLSGRVVVAHNARFDLNFLYWESVFAGKPVTLNSLKYFDTMSLASHVFPRARDKKLETLVDLIKANLDSMPGRGFHDALFDVHAEGELLRHYLRKVPDLVARGITSAGNLKVSQIDFQHQEALARHRESELEALRLITEIESRQIPQLALRDNGEVLFLGQDMGQRNECESWARKFGFGVAGSLTKSRTVLVVLGDGDFNRKPLLQADKWEIPMLTIGQLRKI